VETGEEEEVNTGGLSFQSWWWRCSFPYARAR